MSQEDAMAGGEEPAEPGIDRAAISVTPLSDDVEEKVYWLSRTPHERLRHQEYLQRINYGERANERMQRVLEVVRDASDRSFRSQ